jgi:tRNA-specific 2-thiouridylase
MSGGVDSSVAATLLKDEGEDVFGIMLRLWSAGPEHLNRCCTPDDVARARQVAGQLDIPFYVLDVKEEFKSNVVDPFISGYAKGLTPNPCISCNRNIRFGFLLDHALALGATHLATGHYARLRQADGQIQLLRGVDSQKDQSYVLSVLDQAQLPHARFPLGDLNKAEVRQIAGRLRLPSAHRPDSQDLCFLGDQDYRAFLDANDAIGPPGKITDVAGRDLGQHAGLARYTIGQRKGLGISAPAPLYVIEKIAAGNTLVVGTREELGRMDFRISEINWISGNRPTANHPLHVQVRYKAMQVGCRIRSEADHIQVFLDQPLPDITPGQQAVFYAGELCLGGGRIDQ